MRYISHNAVCTVSWFKTMLGVVNLSQCIRRFNKYYDGYAMLSATGYLMSGLLMLLVAGLVNIFVGSMFIFEVSSKQCHHLLIRPSFYLPVTSRVVWSVEIIVQSHSCPYDMPSSEHVLVVRSAMNCRHQF